MNECTLCLFYWCFKNKNRVYFAFKAKATLDLLVFSLFQRGGILQYLHGLLRASLRCYILDNVP